MKINRTQLRQLISEIAGSTPDKVKVYHMFGQKRQHTGGGDLGAEVAKEQILDRVKAVMTQGFIPSGDLGAQYGKGLYGIAAQEFENPEEWARNLFGSYALEFEIKDFSRYLVFNYERAKLLKGARFKLIDQFADMGLAPETILFTYREGRYNRKTGKREYTEIKKTALDFSNDVDDSNEWGIVDEDDSLQEAIIDLSYNKRLNIDGCFTHGFFVCWNLDSVVLTGYCDDVSSGEIKPLPNISMT